MKCKNCGNELSQSAKFCMVCGTKTDDGDSIVNTYSSPEPSSVSYAESFVKPVYTSDEQTIITKNLNYYVQEFQSIRETGKCRFNWASFFLGLYHAAYRNVFVEWLKFAGIPAIGGLVVLIIGSLVSAVTGTLPPLVVGFGLSVVAEIIGFIMQILFAKNFNKIYMKHVNDCIAKNKIKPDPSVIRSVIAVIVYSAALSLAGTIAGASTAGSMLSVFDKSENDFIFDDSDDFFSDAVSETTEAFHKESQATHETTAAANNSVIPDYIITDSHLRLITEEELLRLSPEEIELAGLEILARKGVYFGENEVSEFQRSWFESKDWYDPYIDLDSFNSNLELYLNDYEMANLSLIIPFVEEADEFEYYGDASGEFVNDTIYYILPYSDSMYYTEAELRTLTKDDLRLARNEIYARHGRIFNAEDLNSYFRSMPWYYPNYTAKEFDAFGDDIFNEYEIANRDLIQKLESK